MIKSTGDLQSILKNYDSAGWTKKANLNTEFNIPKVDTKVGDVNQGSEQTFGEVLANSLEKVNTLQHDANVAMEKLATGQSKNLHETMIAVEKADIAFKAMNQIRQKVISAYQEIMKMQV